MPNKNKKSKKINDRIELRALEVVGRIGSVPSLIIHPAFFLLFFFLGVLGLDWNRLLLILTTVVSLEAIYLSIFIQMTVNRNTESLAEVEEDIEEIQEDIDDIQEDVDEIQEDVDEIVEDEREAETHDEQQASTLRQIQTDIKALSELIEKFSKKVPK